ncbi:MAG TPA: flagellar hook-length control protein FliK [Povalibacter sp.]
MTAPMLPAAPPAVTQPPAAAQTTEVPAGDFLLMLGQLLGAPVAQASGKPATATASADTDLDTEEAAQDAVAITGVPVPVTILPTAPPLKAEGENIAAAATTTSRSGMAADAALAKSLLEAGGKAEMEEGDAPQGQASFTTDMSQQLRISAAPDAGPTRSLHHPVGTSAWADELSTRMVLMSERGQYSASLRLNPEHLGPLEVRISVRDDQASVWFGSAHADTRAAIEQALPRLRELFASQGLSLTDTGVHHDAPREQPKSSAQSNGSLSGVAAESEATTATLAVKLGLVDAYA